ncbi:MAG: glycosyltransferase [Flavobacteriales bacterium]|nr:glycosyltransferase [Flavobacteriales bacterium]
MLSIIIPYYKISFFKETLLSLEQQTCKDFRLFIADDKSPDNSEKLIEEILKTIPYQYKKYTSNFGGENLVKQWDRVINDANLTEWFMILGDDDVISENFVEQFYKNLSEIERNNCNVIKFSQCWIDEIGKPLNGFTKYTQLLDSSENLNLKLSHAHRSSLSEYIFKANSYKRFGFQNFPLAWGSDDIAVLEFSEENNIFFIDKAHVLVRMSSENISGKDDNKPEKLQAKMEYEKYLLKNHYQKLEKKYLRNLIDQHIYESFHHKTPLGFSLLGVYLYLKEYKKILALPKTYYILNQKK